VRRYQDWEKKRLGGEAGSEGYLARQGAELAPRKS
jgi:hypothetical protein